MIAALTGEGQQAKIKPRKRQPAFAPEDRAALDEDSPFLLLAAAVVQQARVDQAHRCSSNCLRCGKSLECQRAVISARFFLAALSASDRADGGVWLDWLQYAAMKAGLTRGSHRGYSP